MSRKQDHEFMKNISVERFSGGFSRPFSSLIRAQHPACSLLACIRQYSHGLLTLNIPERRRKEEETRRKEEEARLKAEEEMLRQEEEMQRQMAEELRKREEQEASQKWKKEELLRQQEEEKERLERGT